MSGLGDPRSARIMSTTRPGPQPVRQAPAPSRPTVDLVLEELAIKAVDLMLERLTADQPPTRPTVVKPKLHWRASTMRC